MRNKLGELIGVILGIVLVAVVVFGYIFMIESSRKIREDNQGIYDIAMNIMETGDYATAGRMFKDLGVFGDAEDRYAECYDKLEEIQNEFYSIILEGYGA